MDILPLLPDASSGILFFANHLRPHSEPSLVCHRSYGKPDFRDQPAESKLLAAD
jgi:hypothetical protein